MDAIIFEKAYTIWQNSAVVWKYVKDRYVSRVSSQRGNEWDDTMRLINFKSGLKSSVKMIKNFSKLNYLIYPRIKRYCSGDMTANAKKIYKQGFSNIAIIIGTPMVTSKIGYKQIFANNFTSLFHFYSVKQRYSDEFKR